MYLAHVHVHVALASAVRTYGLKTHVAVEELREIDEK
jgi:hypothetical protein